ncbi:MAG: class I SAM-dependent methyltransferase [Chloroflexota bacterium]
MSGVVPALDSVLALWAEQVRASRTQRERLRELPPPEDFFARSTGRFRDDPHRRDDAALDALLSLVRPGETWLDIGPGAGRYTLPIALAAQRVIGVDSSPSMLEALREQATRHRIQNLETIQGEWPLGTEPAVAADVALICNVGYGREDIGPFIESMQRAARRRCVALMRWRHPSASLDPLWPEVFGEPRLTLPAMRELLVVLLAMGATFDVRTVVARRQSFASPDEAVAFAMHQTQLRPGGARALRLTRAVHDRLVERDGRFWLDDELGRVGVVNWAPTGRFG